jgi:hypothetical protein
MSATQTNRQALSVERVSMPAPALLRVVWFLVLHDGVSSDLKCGHVLLPTYSGSASV